MPKDNSKAARAQRATDAASRQERRDCLSDAQQSGALDARLGVGHGERKERKRLG